MEKQAPITRARVWLIGFLVSLAVPFAASVILKNSVNPLAHDPELGICQIKPGAVHRHRTEGFAKTRCGKHGIAATEDIGAIRLPKIAVWGDSFVEAYQVDDEKKMQSVLNRHLKTASLDYYAFAVGRSGWSVPDILYAIPRYASVADDIRHHYILLVQWRDTLPNQESCATVEFIYDGDYRFNEITICPSRTLSVRNALCENGLDFLWVFMKTAGKRLVNFRRGLKWRRVAPVAAAGGSSAEIDKTEAWSFLLRAIRQITDCPVTFVYVPCVPRIDDNRIRMRDGDSENAALFQRLCEVNGIGFINLAATFTGEYLRTRKFPRGFFNTIPSRGHLNAFGHMLTAREIFNHFKNNTVHLK